MLKAKFNCIFSDALLTLKNKIYLTLDILHCIVYTVLVYSVLVHTTYRTHNELAVYRVHYSANYGYSEQAH